MIFDLLIVTFTTELVARLSEDGSQDSLQLYLHESHHPDLFSEEVYEGRRD